MGYDDWEPVEGRLVAEVTGRLQISLAGQSTNLRCYPNKRPGRVGQGLLPGPACLSLYGEKNAVHVQERKASTFALGKSTFEPTPTLFGRIVGGHVGLSTLWAAHLPSHVSRFQLTPDRESNR